VTRRGIVWDGEEKKATVNGIEEYMQKGKKHPWIKIIKERSLYKHKYKNGYLKQRFLKLIVGRSYCVIDIALKSILVWVHY
jgi:hypothetical protein